MGAPETRVTLVTGASSGIGAAAARLFAARGDCVVLVARREERLRRVADELLAAGGAALVRACDLTDPEAPGALAAWVEAERGRLDVVVNNAGFGQQQTFETMPAGDVERMFRVNVLGPMALSRAALPLLRRRGGCIVNVASVGGVVAHPLNVAYCASKHALVGFSKALHLELRGSGVRVVVVCPAATRTEFFDQAERDIPFDPLIARTMAPAERVAAAILRASEGDRPVVFPTWGAWFLAWLDRWFPRLSRLANVRYRDKVLAGAAARLPR